MKSSSDRQPSNPSVAPAELVLHKGLGRLQKDSQPRSVAELGWNLLREDISLPSAVLYQEKLLNNLNWMRQFIAEYGVKLAPHGKTTMAPKLFDLQLQAGAWGITLATAQQTFVAYQYGIRRILMANELVGKENMAIISRLIEDSALDFYCLVDSATQIEQLGAFYSKRGQCLQVLLELGVAGGRTGIRDEEQLQSALAALARFSNTIALTGVEIYEGILEDEEAIRAYLLHAVAITRRLAEESHFRRERILLSGAGSAWYDVVAEVFSAAQFGETVEIILRPGCYLTHDVGVYREAQARIQQRNPVARAINHGLIPALQVWAYVQSVPESSKAIIGMGKRDAAFDAGLPHPALHFRPGDSTPKAVPAHWLMTKMMDQHSFLQIAPDDDIRVGDMVAFDISHPCLTFDKWRSLPVLNAHYQVVDIVQTFF